MPSLRIIGPGRAGLALAGALGDAGWEVREPLGRGDAVTGAAHGVDLLVIATPDAAIAAVAAAVEPDPHAVVGHLAGARGLGELAPHERRVGIHPLMALPPPPVGAARLHGAWFALAGHPIGAEVVAALGGRSFPVADDQRVGYHAAAVVASNHLVALLGQVERIAAATGVPFEPYLDLVRATVDNVAELGPAAALTGPAARGDRATVDAHLAAIDPTERPGYEALFALARRLVEPEPAPGAE